MAVTQTVEIPANRRLIIDVPPEVPEGRAEIMYFPAVKAQEKELSPFETFIALAGIDKKDVPPFASLWGLHKGRDTLDAYFERKRTDKTKEDAQILRQLGLDEFPKVPKKG